MIQNYNYITPEKQEQIKAKINNGIIRGEAIAKISAVLLETFKAFDGKKITKRMQTAVKDLVNKAIGQDLVAFYDDEYSTIHIRFWGGKREVPTAKGMEPNTTDLIGYNDACNFILGSKEKPFDFKAFESRYTPWVKPEYVEQYKKALDELDDLTKQYNEILMVVDKFYTDTLKPKSMEYIFPTIEVGRD